MKVCFKVWCLIWGLALQTAIISCTLAARWRARTGTEVVFDLSISAHKLLCSVFSFTHLLCIFMEYISLPSQKRELLYNVFWHLCSSLWHVRIDINPVSNPKSKNQTVCSSWLQMFPAEALGSAHSCLLQSSPAPAAVCRLMLTESLLKGWCLHSVFI